jgi:hypothetical protein
VSKAQISHWIECSRSAYWRCVFDEEYNRRLNLEAFGYAEYRLLESREDEHHLIRRSFTKPKSIDLPAALTRALGDGSSVEDGRFDKDTERYQVTWTLSFLGDRVDMGADIWIDEASADRIKRVADVRVDVSLPIIGWALDRAIVADVERAWRVLPEFTRKFVSEKGWNSNA